MTLPLTRPVASLLRIRTAAPRLLASPRATTRLALTHVRITIRLPRRPSFASRLAKGFSRARIRLDCNPDERNLPGRRILGTAPPLSTKKMSQKKINRAAFLAFLALSLTTSAAGKQPAPQVLGLRLGMSYERAHARLSEIGQFKSEDEGQQVWTLRNDKHYQYLIIGFDRERNVRYVTVLA